MSTHPHLCCALQQTVVCGLSRQLFIGSMASLFIHEISCSCDDVAAVEEMRTQMEEELRRNQEEMAAMQETWQQKMAEREKEFQVREIS